MISYYLSYFAMYLCMFLFHCAFYISTWRKYFIGRSGCRVQHSCRSKWQLYYRYFRRALAILRIHRYSRNVMYHSLQFLVINKGKGVLSNVGNHELNVRKFYFYFLITSMCSYFYEVE